MKYKVGDKVRVRKDLVIGERYGRFHFIESMEKFKGKEVTIEKIMKDGYGIKEMYCTWTDEMLEPVTDEEKDLFEYALKKLDMTKEELEKELYDKEEELLLAKVILEYHEKFKEYCHNTFCSENECKIKKFRNDNNCRGMSCEAVFMAMEILKDSKEFLRK